MTEHKASNIEDVSYQFLLGKDKYFVTTDRGREREQWFDLIREAPGCVDPEVTNENPTPKMGRLLYEFNNQEPGDKSGDIWDGFAHEMLRLMKEFSMPYIFTSSTIPTIQSRAHSKKPGHLMSPDLPTQCIYAGHPIGVDRKIVTYSCPHNQISRCREDDNEDDDESLLLEDSTPSCLVVVIPPVQLSGVGTILANLVRIIVTMINRKGQVNFLQGK